MCYRPGLTATFTRLFPDIGSRSLTEPSSPEASPCLERDKLSARPPQHYDFDKNSNQLIPKIFVVETGRLMAQIVVLLVI